MLFKTIEEFCTYAEPNKGIKFTSLKPSIDHAESKFIKPIIGESFFADLQNLYDTNHFVEDELQTFFFAIQKALASLTLYLYAGIGEIQMTDSGLKRTETESQKSAYKYQVENLRKEMLERGFEYLENAVQILEANLTNPKFEPWIGSPEFNNYKSLFIGTGREFAQLYSTIRYPRRVYTLLRTTMFNVQELDIAPAITQEVYDALAAKQLLTEPAFTDAEAQLLVYVKNAIAHLTIAKGLTNLLATMDENGVHIIGSRTDTTAGTLSSRQPATDNYLSLMIADARKLGLQWLEKAKAYMQVAASETVFPTLYTEIEAAALAAIPDENINTKLTGTFSM